MNDQLIKTKDLVDKIAELALGLYFAEVAVPKLPHGRLKNRMERLALLSIRELSRMPPSVRQYHKQANDRVMGFVALMKWERKSFAFPTMVNFLLGLYDEKPWAAPMIPVLRDIYDYFDRAGNVRPASLWSAGQAADVWADLGKGV